MRISCDIHVHMKNDQASTIGALVTVKHRKTHRVTMKRSLTHSRTFY